MRHLTTRGRVLEMMRALGEAARSEGRIYFTGGVSAVLLGWRETTVDMDIKLDPEPEGIFESIPALKNSLELNIELASPDLFIPELPGWRERSQFIDRIGKVDFLHYDFYSQALAKLERGHSRDLSDVAGMLEMELIAVARLRDLFESIQDGLIRYPAIDPDQFRSQVDAFTS